MRLLSLVALLFAFWLALSGNYTVFLTGMGVVSAVFCALVAVRMRVLDEEGHPTHLLGRALTFYPWLGWEIVKSAWSVSKIILDPKLPISPTMTVVDASQKTTAGIATYGNSITLTPGTITTDVQGQRLTIHALVKENAVDLEAGGMDARVRKFEGSV
jgi:multicomponent Na+:H+ antiporter subunit E